MLKTAIAKITGLGQTEAHRQSALIREEIEDVEAARAKAEAQLASLEEGADAALLAGDEEAERHDAEIARVRRDLKRAELRLPALRDELAQSEAAEHEAAKQRRRDEADAAIAKLSKTYRADYERHAGALAALLAKAAEVEEMAAAAGVESLNSRLRMVPGAATPARREQYTVWVGPGGRESATRPAYSSMTLNPKTGKYEPDFPGELDGWHEEARTRVIEGRRESDICPVPITQEVRLPGFSVGAAPFWPHPPKAEPEPERPKFLTTPAPKPSPRVEIDETPRVPRIRTRMIG